MFAAVASGKETGIRPATPQKNRVRAFAFFTRLSLVLPVRFSPVEHSARAKILWLFTEQNHEDRRKKRSEIVLDAL